MWRLIMICRSLFYRAVHPEAGRQNKYNTIEGFVRRRIRNRLKRAVGILLFLAFLLLLNILSRAGTETGEIWLGFMAEESGSEGGRSAGSDGKHAYGIFQFDDRYDLIPFLGRCLEEDPEKYSAFGSIYQKYAAVGNSGKSTVSTNEADTAELIAAWHGVYDADPEGFTAFQIECFIEDYYGACYEGCLKRGIDLSGDDFSPVIRGTLMSISIWAGQYQGGVQDIIATLTSDMSEEEMLDACYSMKTANLKSGKNHNAYVERWTRSQKARAAQNFAVWKNGQEIMTSESTDLNERISTSGGGILRGIDGGSYSDYIRGWISSHTGLSMPFQKSGGWNRENRDWVIALRSQDFYKAYGILGGAPDFQEAASSGIWFGSLALGNVDVRNLSIPAVDYDLPDGVMPVVYYSQSAGTPWAGMAFGGGNIASSGCSITAAAMAVTYLKCGSDISDASSLVTPDMIVDEIARRNGGNYNRYYDAGVGQSWDIFPAIAGYYGIQERSINSGSLIRALQAGHPVVISTSGPKSDASRWGIFTQSGHFILATGYDPETGLIYVNDPNGSHSSYSAQGFTLATIEHEAKGYFEFYV